LPSRSRVPWHPYERRLPEPDSPARRWRASRPARRPDEAQPDRGGSVGPASPSRRKGRHRRSVPHLPCRRGRSRHRGDRSVPEGPVLPLASAGTNRHSSRLEVAAALLPLAALWAIAASRRSGQRRGPRRGSSARHRRRGPTAGHRSRGLSSFRKSRARRTSSSTRGFLEFAQRSPWPRWRAGSDGLRGVPPGQTSFQKLSLFRSRSRGSSPRHSERRARRACLQVVPALPVFILDSPYSSVEAALAAGRPIAAAGWRTELRQGGPCLSTDCANAVFFRSEEDDQCTFPGEPSP
jgi:hypothetical protein